MTIEIKCRNGYGLDYEEGEEEEEKAGRGWCRRWCFKSHNNWIVMRSLQSKDKASGGSGKFFKESCVDRTERSFACYESCEGVYRTFSGCCNNLVNTEYGQIIQFDSSNILEFHY